MNLVQELLDAGFKNQEAGYDPAGYDLAWYGLYGTKNQHVFVKGDRKVVLEIASSGLPTQRRHITFYQGETEVSKSTTGELPRQEFLASYLDNSFKPAPYDAAKDPLNEHKDTDTGSAYDALSIWQEPGEGQIQLKNGEPAESKPKDAPAKTVDASDHDEETSAELKEVSKASKDLAKGTTKKGATKK